MVKEAGADLHPRAVQKMRRNITRRIRVYAFTAVLLVSAGGDALAAGPVGTMPIDGNGSGSGFTIDHAGFDAGNVALAPCPANSVCTNSIGMTGSDGLLMREVHDTLTDARYIQFIVHESDAVAGDFTYESLVSARDAVDSIGTKQVIDDFGNEFHTTHAMYRGALFGDTGGSVNADTGYPALEMRQVIGGGFQVIDFETTDIPEPYPDGTEQYYLDYFPYDGRMQIVQYGAGEMPDFSYTVLRGLYQPLPGFSPEAKFELGGVTIPIGDEVTATWIGAAMPGGGPGSSPEQRDFGLLIYRAYYGNVGPTNGYDWVPHAEVRAFSLKEDQNDSGQMHNPDHGAFVGGAAILDDFWRDDIFGDSPF